MKCPKCGYVSFDDLTECKKCGAVLKTAGEAESAEPLTRLQEELFSLGAAEAVKGEIAEDRHEAPAEDSLRLENESPAEGEEEEFTLVAAEAQEVPLGLPSMSVEFDPAEGEAEEGGKELELEAEQTDLRREEAGKEHVPEPRPAEAVIDDETRFPEELWVEEGAGFFPRLAALAVDGLILVGVLSLFFFGAMAALSSGGYGWSYVRTPEGIYALSVPFYLLGLFVSLGYFTFFVGWAARTPGKALLALDVRRTDGGPMTYSRAFLRWVGYLVSITFAGLGFLWVFFDERKRGWHDYLSGTWVKNLRHES